MKYIGNKTRLLPFIDSVVQSEAITGLTFLDPFAGTASVASHFKKKGWRVVSGDIQTYSLAQQKALVETVTWPDFSPAGFHEAGETALRKALAHLNGLTGEEGFFFRNYAPSGPARRQYFTDANARRIDAIRAQIHAWTGQGLSSPARWTLLASLIDAADFVANMSGTYGAYLKIWRSVALKPLRLEPPRITLGPPGHRSHLADANDLVAREPCDLLYLDPPYTGRQYCGNFHILETLARGDEPPLRGKTGLRPLREQRSRFCLKGQAPEALLDLISKAQCRHILLSYSDEGLIPHQQVLEILSSRGPVTVHEHVYRRFRTERDHARRRYKRPEDRVLERIYAVSVS